MLSARSMYRAIQNRLSAVRLRSIARHLPMVGLSPIARGKLHSVSGAQ